MLISTPNLEEARKQLQKIRKTNPDEQIIVKAQDEEFNKKILEMKNPINVLLSPEIHDRKDRLKQRDSGLNEFLCKLAKKNNIKIAIDMNHLQKLDKKDKSIVLARIKQNIMLCKKAKCQIIILPKEKYTKQDIMAFMLSLGASTQQAKESIFSN